MAKRRKLATRAFGAEPGMPGVPELAEWIAEHRGRTADIVTYRLDRSLAPQVAAGIGTPCAGGRFYAERIRRCLYGVAGSRAVGELHVDAPAIAEDAAGIVVRAGGAWCSMPAPHELGIADGHYNDDDEWLTAICGAYRTIMRAMRDTGVAGHVLIADRMDDAEISCLARQKVFFFAPAPDRGTLETLLEHQTQVAAGKDQLGTLFGLAGEYTLKRVLIVDPDPESIRLALDHLDPDQVTAAGYNADGDGEYWEGLVSRAVYDT